MTDDARLLRLELQNQIVGNRAFMAGDPAIAERYGTSFAMVAGLACSTCATWDHALFNRVIGAGVLAPFDGRILELISAHFASKGRVPTIEVYEGFTPPDVVTCIERAGFAPTGHSIESHVLHAEREVDPPASGPSCGWSRRRSVVTSASSCATGSTWGRAGGSRISSSISP